ncbi:MAG: cob(I)yrinic acid a,c-diamide adenosyltransferase [Phycisphaerae bacterium]|nr:cob(I)yrinic acid a,c-diamide adenosyltransferase [Phycisphaerae bacterium]
MSIYTKVGDQGSMRFPDGRLGRKSEPVVAAWGSLDELNSHVGLCLCEASARGFVEIVDALSPIQGQIMTVSAMLMQVPGKTPIQLDNTAVGRLENIIDDIDAALGPLKNFIVPGGSELACRLHVARTVCRRAERDLVATNDHQHPLEPATLPFINRLSDLLFNLARLANHQSGANEPMWTP